MISLLRAKTRWNEKSQDEEEVKRLSQSLHITPFVISLLMNRGLQTEQEIVDFLFTEQQFHDPFLLHDMKLAVPRILHAIEEGERILIFGDYDADGVSSTTLLMLTLEELHANVSFYIPNRFTEGYGPNEAAFRWAKDEGFSLIITVDTGISAIKEAEVAKEIGLDLIITDHHEISPQLPDAYAIIHPRIGDSYPFQHLAGVGVAFKLSHALLGRVPEHLLDIAVIGTIADLVPLFGENRLIAKKGIEKLRETSRPGYRALFQVANINANEINEESIGYSIGPRINAVGRLGDADPAVQLLITNDLEEARFLAGEIDSTNRLRQDIVKKIADEAIQEVEDKYSSDQNKVLVIAKEGWNAGVIGIVASKLVERYYRPTILLSIDREKGIAKGSARSIEGFDLFANLSTCRDLLPHFGGHAMAAGMSLSLGDVDDLRSRLNQLADATLSEEQLFPITDIDTTCTLGEVTISAIEELQLLAPFGVGNPKPCIRIEEAAIESIRQIGSDGSHIKLLLRDGDTKLDCVGFGFGHVAEEISPMSRVSVVGEVSINEWNHFRKPQIMISDLAVNYWQLFDYRGDRNIEKFLLSLPEDKVTAIYFQKAISAFSLPGALLQAKEVTEQLLTGRYVVLLDLPVSMDEVEKLFAKGFPERIYAVFHQENQHTFSTVPTRDHFKWYFAFLRQQAPFSLSKHGAKLCQHKGWSKDTVIFMTQVFFELEFVTIKDGLIFMSDCISKRDLLESATYREKINGLQVEKELVYSTYQQLFMWFSNMQSSSLTCQEAY